MDENEIENSVLLALLPYTLYPSISSERKRDYTHANDGERSGGRRRGGRLTYLNGRESGESKEVQKRKAERAGAPPKAKNLSFALGARAHRLHGGGQMKSWLPPA